MSRILVVDDDPDMRALIGAYVKGAGHVPAFAADGVAGLEELQRHVPDLIITDFQMPRLDGFGFFSAVRADPSAARVPVVMVTAHNSREMMGKALRLGVDDFLGKPFQMDELLRVIEARLNPAAAAPAVRAEGLGAALQSEFTGSLACCEIRGIEWLRGTLSKAETDELLAQFVRDADHAVSRDHGTLLQSDERHWVAVFDDASGPAETHAVRALRSALGLVLAAQRLKPWIANRFAGREIADFVVAVGVHTGTIRTRAAGGKTLLAGEAADIALFLAQSGGNLHWSIAASRATAKSAGFGFSAGRGLQLRMAAGGTVLAVEVKGPQRSDAEVPEVRRTATLVEAAVDRNAALLMTTPAPPAEQPEQPLTETQKLAIVQPELVSGYKVVRRLARKGIVSVYLVNPSNDGGPPAVLKTLVLPDDKTRRMHLKRWVDQYAAISTVLHPNVAQTFAQGLTDTHLYVVQEYCPGGDLRNLIAERMIVGDAMKALLRIAGGVRAALQRGFVHGEIKPANVLIRADGTLAVVDFGLASAVEYAMGEADAGVIVRSPEYLSPEMINGQPPDAQSDVYMLGLLLHEVLTGRRAYDSPDLSRIMADHLAAPAPRLPAGFERFQLLLDKLMAKNRPERFASVQDALNFMTQARLQA